VGPLIRVSFLRISGRYQVPGTQLWGDMPGIEISFAVNSNIKAVADGVVSAIFDLGGGQTVVIRHGKYFTYV
jgi:murein DD-endopeptidase MepM/ murein hydrolase activator NlpD